MDKELEQVLAAKEIRWNKRLELSRQYKCPVISITLCLPLKYRTADKFKAVFADLCGIFADFLESKNLTPLASCQIDGYDGSALFFAVKGDAGEIKRLCVEFEEMRKCYRILDIDIMDENQVPIGREDIKYPNRKCFICEKDSAICIKLKTHNKEELENCVNVYFEEAMSIIKT